MHVGLLRSLNHIRFLASSLVFAMASPLIGNIVERKASTSTPTAPSTASSLPQRGFPVAKHRTQSAFARARQQANQARPQQPPIIQPIAVTPAKAPIAVDHDARSEDWRSDMDQRNNATIEQMSDQQRQEAISEIFDTLGDGVGDLLRRAREARERKTATAGTTFTGESRSLPVGDHPAPLQVSTLAGSSTRPTSPEGEPLIMF